MNPSSKQLDFVDWLTDCMRGSRSLPGFPRTLQTNHIPFPGWPESWQIPNEALIQTADTVYCTYLHTASIFFRPFFFYFSSVMPGMGTFTKSLHKHTSPTAIVSLGSVIYKCIILTSIFKKSSTKLSCGYQQNISHCQNRFFLEIASLVNATSTAKHCDLQVPAVQRQPLRLFIHMFTYYHKYPAGHSAQRDYSGLNLSWHRNEQGSQRLRWLKLASLDGTCSTNKKTNCTPLGPHRGLMTPSVSHSACMAWSRQG